MLPPMLPLARLNACDIVWTTPSVDAAGSMPVGNGEVVLNVWVEDKTGDLLFLIARTDALSEISRFLKLGRVRVHLSGSPLRAHDFKQHLSLHNGTITVSRGGSSLTLFADRNTELSVFGLFNISAGQTQFFNAAFIVILAPIMAAMWTKLAAAGREPSIPVKFGVALVGVGAGFLFLVWGGQFAGDDFKVGLWWLAGLYFIHSAAELCISPVGLSMITKLSIARIVGLMMGVWFLSISVAQYVAGVVAQVASVETVGGQVTNLKVSLDTYNGVFWTIGLVAAGIGLLLLLISPVIRKWMHGVQ